MPTENQRTPLQPSNQGPVQRRIRQGMQGYLFVLPALMVYGVFFLWPLVQLVVLSFQDWDGLSARHFVGLENFRLLLFHDQVFWQAFSHNCLWLIAAEVVPVAIGLVLAILLSRSRMHGRTFFRALYFAPQVLSSVVVAVIWRWIYNPSFGALNTLLGAVGLSSLQRGWLGEASLAFPALFIAYTWVGYGFTMVIFLAALQDIDETYFDAAKVDGAGPLQQLRHILIPAIRGPLTTVLLITAIGSFQVFDLVFILTRGGPGFVTQVLAMYMYQNAFPFSRVSYGAAIAVTLGLIILVFSVIFLRVRGALREEG
jgi:raffinose/stachyose/melibiose transport system permease protein